MEKVFYPPRRTGLLIQGALILALAAAGGYFFYMATQDASGLDFLYQMLIALVLFAPLPLLVYRLYALMNGQYGLRRDGLMIRWGLRREDIPLNTVEWIRPASDLGFRLPLPWLRLPGSILGARKVPELGQVEYIASDTAHMILVATPEKVFAISPEQPNQFLAFFRQLNELGSLSPIEAQSVYPTVLIGRVWEDRLARILIISGFAIGLVLLIVNAIAIPGLDTITWTGGEGDAPAERLLLLSILDGMIWLFNLFAGIFLYRRGDDLVIGAYVLWGTAGLAGVLLLLGSLTFIF
ncbi:MAG: PH domain-containing protein [Chloroflexota bacterium]|nr:PH domain-containing protein [Chloroflexota bacterium]